MIAVVAVVDDDNIVVVVVDYNWILVYLDLVKQNKKFKKKINFSRKKSRFEIERFQFERFRIERLEFERFRFGFFVEFTLLMKTFILPIFIQLKL